MTLKLAQLAALPLTLLAVAALVTPRDPRLPTVAGPWPSPRAGAPRTASVFAAGAAPAGVIDLAAVSARGVPSRRGWFQVTVVASLVDPASASAVAGELTTLLGESAQHFEDPANAGARARLLDEGSPAPPTPAESTAFAHAGVNATTGIGWPGARADVRDAIVVLGPVVIVPGLKGDFSGLQRNPLADLLERRGARVHVEGEPGGGRPLVVDVTCAAPDDAAASRIADAVLHYLEAPPSFALRPPWHPAGVSAVEARARSSYARLRRALHDVLEALPAEFARRFNPYLGPEDADAALADLHQVMRERAAALVDAAAKDGTHDAVVVAELRRVAAAFGPRLAFEVTDPAARRRLGDRMGALSLDVAAPAAPGAPAALTPTPDELAYAARGLAQASGRRVELGRLAFHRVGKGLPALLVWLRGHHVSDARIAVVGIDVEGHAELEGE